MILSWITRAATAAIGGILAYLVALLPERVKERAPFSEFQSVAAHIVSGLSECAFSLAILVYGYNQFANGYGQGVSNALAGAQGTGAELPMPGMGVLRFILYLLHPVALISFYVLAEGYVRAFSAYASGRYHGLGILWAIDRAAAFMEKKRRAAILREQLGPFEPDSISKEEGAGTLTLMSVEDKDWRDRQVAQYGDGFYMLTARSYVRRGRYYRFRYTFRPMTPGEIIRGRLVILPSA